MNQELLDIRDLSKVDVEMDELRAEAGALAAAVRTLRARIDTQMEMAKVLAAKLDEAREAERTFNRRMSDFTAKAVKTRKLMDEGKAFDYIAAEKQHGQLVALADDAETSLLEAMEAREELESQEVEENQQQLQTRAEHDVARRHEASRRPEISARYSHLKPTQAERTDAIASHHRNRYNDMRRKGIAPVADVVDGSCEGCHLEPPPQVANDINTGSTRINNCRGCGAFFFDIRTTEPDEEEEEEEQD